jgi:hypothetical protein
LGLWQAILTKDILHRVFARRKFRFIKREFQLVGGGFVRHGRWGWRGIGKWYAAGPTGPGTTRRQILGGLKLRQLLAVFSRENIVEHVVEHVLGKIGFGSLSVLPSRGQLYGRLRAGRD